MGFALFALSLWFLGVAMPPLLLFAFAKAWEAVDWLREAKSRRGR